jgi:hypothetical protein
MEFGRKPLKWMNFVSSALEGELFVENFGASLCRSGSITIPHFADSRHDVFARIYYREGKKQKPSREKAYLALSGTSVNELVTLLPGRKPSSFVLNLGPGTNEYSPEELDLVVTADGESAERAAHLPCFVIPAVRVWTLPNSVESPVFFPADDDHEPFFAEGFHRPERDSEGSWRWSKPRALVRLPGIKEGVEHPSLIVKAAELRPPSFRHHPEFLFNGEKVAAEKRKETEGVVSYVLTDLSWLRGRSNELEIIVEAFNPKNDTGSNDERNLGIGVRGIQIAF